jgi:hypothetical protein
VVPEHSRGVFGLELAESGFLQVAFEQVHCADFGTVSAIDYRRSPSVEESERPRLSNVSVCGRAPS